MTLDMRHSRLLVNYDAVSWIDSGRDSACVRMDGVTDKRKGLVVILEPRIIAIVAEL